MNESDAVSSCASAKYAWLSQSPEAAVMGTVKMLVVEGGHY